MSSSKFLMTRDLGGYNGFGVSFVQDARSLILTATIEQHFTVPSNFPNWLAIFSFSPGTNVWVDGINTAVVPTGAVSATTAILNPAARSVKAGQVISMITTDSTLPQVGIELFVISPES